MAKNNPLTAKSIDGTLHAQLEKSGKLILADGESSEILHIEELGEKVGTKALRIAFSEATFELFIVPRTGKVITYDLQTRDVKDGREISQTEENIYDESPATTMRLMAQRFRLAADQMTGAKVEGNGKNKRSKGRKNNKRHSTSKSTRNSRSTTDTDLECSNNIKRPSMSFSKSTRSSLSTTDTQVVRFKELGDILDVICDQEQKALSSIGNEYDRVVREANEAKNALEEEIQKVAMETRSLVKALFHDTKMPPLPKVENIPALSDKIKADPLRVKFERNQISTLGMVAGHKNLARISAPTERSAKAGHSAQKVYTSPRQLSLGLTEELKLEYKMT